MTGVSVLMARWLDEPTPSNHQRLVGALEGWGDVLDQLGQKREQFDDGSEHGFWCHPAIVSFAESFKESYVQSA